MRAILRALIGAASLILLIGIVLGLAAPLVFALDALAHLRLHFAVLIIPVALAALFLRQWRALWWSLAAATLAFVGLGPLWEDDLPESDGTELVVMTANLYQQNPDVAAMRAALVAADADVLVTHETSKGVQSGPDALTAHYPYRLALWTTGQALRTVIWSKFPMRNGTLMLEDSIEPTGAHATVVLAPDVEVGVVGLHLAHAAFGNQESQIDALTEVTAGVAHPRIVLGDLNATPWSYAMRQVEKRTGTRRIPGYRITWHGHYSSRWGEFPAPIGQPIDHILISPGIGVDAIDLIEIPGSDHLGLRAVLRIPPAQGG